MCVHVHLITKQHPMQQTAAAGMLRVALHGSHERYYESGALHAEVQIVFVLQSRRALEPV